MSPTTIASENNKLRSFKDLDDASVDAATAVAISDVESDLDYLNLDMISKDYIEEETLPIDKITTEDGKIEYEMDDEALSSEAHQSIMDDVDLEGFDLNKIINYSHKKVF